jgi:hypothetical protein
MRSHRMPLVLATTLFTVPERGPASGRKAWR